MAFKATLTLDGKDFQLLSCTYHFNQPVSHLGHPTGSVIGGQIQATLLSSDDTSLAEWMVDPHKTKDGKITFFQIESDQKLKELSFKNAFCVNYSENFASTGSTGLTQSIVISSKKIQIGNAEHENEWPAKN